MRAIDVGAVLEGASDPAESARMLFLVGTVEGYSNEQNLSRKRLDWEKRSKKDIIQVALGEGKAPPTYQHVMALKWMVERCPVARYLLKVDDDVYVNLRDLLRLLQEVLPRSGAQGLLLCHQMYPDRATGLFGLNGWLVPSFEKPYYCSGKAVLYSNDVVTAIYDQVVKAKRFPRKESLLTGKIRKRANITILPLKTRSLPPNTSPEFLQNALWSATFGASPPASRVLFAHQPRSADDLDWLWSQTV